MKKKQKPGVLILIIKSHSNFLSKMSKMSVGNDQLVNEQQTFLPDTYRDPDISGKFRRTWVAKWHQIHTFSPFPPIAHLLLAVATLQLSQLLHQSGSAAHQPSPRRCEPAETPEKGDVGVSKSSGTPKSSILIGFSLINHPFWGAHPYFWKHPCISVGCFPPSRKVNKNVVSITPTVHGQNVLRAAVHGLQDFMFRIS